MQISPEAVRPTPIGKLLTEIETYSELKRRKEKCGLTSFTANLTEIIPLVVEDLHTVSSVVADVDLHAVVDNNPIGKLQVARAAELVEDIADHVEDDDPHDLALDDDDAAAVVRGDSTGMLQDVGSELPDELTVLGEHLDLQWCTCKLFDT